MAPDQSLDTKAGNGGKKRGKDGGEAGEAGMEPGGGKRKKKAED